MSTIKTLFASSIAGLILSLFAVSFSGVGVVMTYLTASMLIDHHRMQSWVETPARIVDLNLDRHTGDDSTTYKVSCTYTYTFNGKPYKSDRVGLTGGSDNIGSWHQDTYERLQATRNEQGGVSCFVNPDYPEQAVLDQTIRYPVLVFYTIFVLAFGGVGLAMLVATGFSVVGRLRKRNVRIAEPGKPWLANPQWAAGIISAKLRSKAVFVWCATGYWIAVTLPTVLYLPGEVTGRQNHLALFALIFPLLGLILVISAVRATSRARRFGGSRLELDTIPGVVGGHLRGRLVLTGDVAAVDEVEVTLKCVQKLTTSSGRRSSTTSYTLWEQTQPLRADNVTFGQTELVIPVDFEIPASCRPTDESNSRDKINWWLDAWAPVPGVDLKMRLEVPVFRTENSLPPPAAGEEDNEAEMPLTDA